MQKTVLVTGGSRGIGKAICKLLATEGYNVVLNYNKSEAQALEIKTELKNIGYNIEIFKADVSIMDQVKDLIKFTINKFGTIDILINNAGISKWGLFTDLTESEWDEIINVNLKSVFNVTSNALPYMINQKSGCIINISSVWGISGASCEVAYSACKGGMNTFTKALAKELAPSNIQVNAIACGCIDTQMNACFSEEEHTALADEIPAGRFGTPKEVADFVLDLSQKHNYLTGQVITLDGGWT